MGDGGLRVGLVLGAGGVVGGAFHAGVLAAIADASGWDPRSAAIAVGTSAGAVTATSLRAGLSASDLLARSEGRPLSPQGAKLLGRAGPLRRPPPLQPAPAPRTAADVAAALGRAVARPLSVRPAALIASLMPEGPVSTEAISTAIGGLFPEDWPDEALWICAVRQADGRRVVFGRDRRAPLPLVVAASCAIPGYYTPVVVDGEAYIDGGAHSPTNLDVLGDRSLGLDLVLASSPMSQRGHRLGFGPRDAVRRWSGVLLDGELLRLRRRGIPVVTFEPTAEDVAVMGRDAMDPARRAAVARQAFESAQRRLAAPDVRARLGPLAS